MSVRQDKRDGHRRWTVDICYRHIDGRVTRVRRDPHRNTRAAAERLEREILAQLASGDWGRKEVKPPTLSEFADRFIDDYAMHNNKPSVVSEKIRILRLHLKPFFGAMRLTEIGPAHIEAFKKAQLVSHEPKTLNNQLVVLSRLLHVAKEWGVVQACPTIKMASVPERRLAFLDFDEGERLMAACDTARLRTMVILALNTGLRSGELRGLQWGDLDRDQRGLTVRRSIWRGCVGTPKHGRTRHVPLNAPGQAALAAWKHKRTLWVFDGATPAGHLGEEEESKPLRQAFKRAGLEPHGWHCLRHSFASQLVMRGVDLYVVQQLLGHRSIKTTERYAHLAPRVTREAVRKLESTSI